MKKRQKKQNKQNNERVTEEAMAMKNRNSGKNRYGRSIGWAAIVATLFFACKKECDKVPGEGQEIIFDQKGNCHIRDIPKETITETETITLIDTLYVQTHDTISVNISTINDIRNNLNLMRYAVSQKKHLQQNWLANVSSSADQFKYLVENNKIVTDAGEKAIINMGGFYICPSAPGIILAYAEWVSWGKPPLGMNMSNGAKFKIDYTEENLFAADGIGSGVVDIIEQVLDKDLAINSVSSLASVNAQIDQWKAQGFNVRVSFTGDFAIGNDGSAGHLTTLFQKIDAGDAALMPGTGKIRPAMDSVAVQNAQLLQRLYNAGALAATTVNGALHFYISDNTTLAHVPQNQVARTYYMKSTDFNSRVIPNELGVEAQNCNAADLVALANAGWPKKMLLTPVPNASLPGGEGCIVRVNDEFLSMLSEPCVPRPNAPYWALVNLILGRYIANRTLTATNGLDVTDINFGTGNESGKMLEASYDKATASNPSLYIQKKTLTNHQVNIVTNNNTCITDDGKIIVSSVYLQKINKIFNINTPYKSIWDNKYIWVPPEEESAYFSWGGWVGYSAYLGAILNDCTGGLNLPAGKQAITGPNPDGTYPYFAPNWTGSSGSVKVNYYQKAR